MDDVLDLLGGCVEALAASAASRAKRNAVADRLIPPPSPGTPLLVSLALAVEHSGVYLGGGRVAELQDDGRVVAVSLTDFVNGSPGAFPAVRTGTRIFAACDAKRESPLARFSRSGRRKRPSRGGFGCPTIWFGTTAIVSSPSVRRERTGTDEASAGWRLTPPLRSVGWNGCWRSA